ncbi:MAG TPA: hypothetical protein VFZ09_40535, partial [Archangium sp.]|nr:hypothetical protein [Archangium sp.]
MSTPLENPHVAARPRRRWWLVLVPLLFSACATGHPSGGMFAGRGPALSLTPPPAPVEDNTPASDAELSGAVVYEVAVVEPGRGTTRPVPVSREDFQRALRHIAHQVQHEGKSPREAAREWLKGQLEQHPEWEQLSGTWVAEVDKGQVLTLVPEDADSRLKPAADESLRERYLLWCTWGRGGGDCLRLLDDGPYLKTDDRRTLALALAFGSVLEETKAALGKELDPQVLVASCMWTLGAYLALWLVPEPTTKLLAAGLSVVLVAWLGV